MQTFEMAIASIINSPVSTRSSDAVDPSTGDPSRSGCGAAAAAAAIVPKRSDEFHLFPELPPEIRQEIWLQAQLEANEGAAGMCILGLKDQSMPDAPLAYPYSSPLRSTNSESRYIALSHDPSPRPFDPARDTLYVRKRAFSVFAYRAYYRRQSEWVGQIRHLALAVGVAYGGVNLRFMIKLMSSLETLSFVMPSASSSDRGEMIDVRAEVDPLKAGSLDAAPPRNGGDGGGGAGLDNYAAIFGDMQWSPPPRLRAFDSLAMDSMKMNADCEVCDEVPTGQLGRAMNAKEYCK